MIGGLEPPKAAKNRLQHRVFAKFCKNLQKTPKTRRPKAFGPSEIRRISEFDRRKAIERVDRRSASKLDRRKAIEGQSTSTEGRGISARRAENPGSFVPLLARRAKSGKNHECDFSHYMPTRSVGFEEFKILQGRRP